jgi:Outer membrane protein beta-barrel domain
MKTLATILLISAFTFSVTAQAEGVSFGIKGGLNLANEVVDPDLAMVNTTSLTGFAAGASLDFTMSPGTAIEVDFLYIRRGANYETAAQDGFGQPTTIEQYSNLDYFVVAPVIRLSVQRQGVFPYVLLGAEIGKMLSATIYTDGGDNGSDTDGDLDYMIRDLDYGLTFGGGVEFPTGDNAFFFEGRYTLGLANVIEEKYAENRSSKNRGIYLFGGMRF